MRGRKKLTIPELIDIWSIYHDLVDDQSLGTSYVSDNGYLYFPGYCYDQKIEGVIELKTLLNQTGPTLIYKT